MINRKRQELEPQFFDNGGSKQDLVDKFVQNKPFYVKQTENRASLDDMVDGKKKFESLQKNTSSAKDYHMIANLSNEQMEA